MLQTKSFYLKIAFLMYGATANMMMFAQAATIAREQMGFTTVATVTVASLLTFFNMSDRLVTGYLSDILGRVNTLGLALVFSVTGLFALSVVSLNDQMLFIAAFCALGIVFGVFLVFSAALSGRISCASYRTTVVPICVHWPLR